MLPWKVSLHAIIRILAESECYSMTHHAYAWQGVRGKYLALIYQSSLSAEAKEAYFKTHVDKASVAEPNGGVHFLYLVSQVKKRKN